MLRAAASALALAVLPLPALAGRLATPPISSQGTDRFVCSVQYVGDRAATVRIVGRTGPTVALVREVGLNRTATSFATAAPCSPGGYCDNVLCVFATDAPRAALRASVCAVGEGATVCLPAY